MATARSDYVHAMRDLWGAGYWTTWQPGVRLRLGDVGSVERGDFVPIDDLASKGIEIQEIPAGGRDDLLYDSNGNAKVELKLTGALAQGFSALTAADAGARITFSNGATVFVLLRGLRETRVRNVPALAEQVVREAWNGWWQKDFAVITHLVSAASGTILLASQSDAAVELRAKAGVGSAGLTVADLGAGVNVARSHGMGFQLTAKTALTPFFRAVWVKDSFWRGIQAKYGAQPLERAPAPPRELLDEAADPEALFANRPQDEEGD